MKKLLGVLWKTVVGLLAVVVLAALVLVGLWLFRREDPTAFMPHDYTVYIQTPSIRDVYDRWLNLEAVDLMLARPELAAYRRVVVDVRGLALTSSPVVSTLLDVQADVLWQKDGKLLIVLDLGWRGIVAPLGRIVGPMLRIPGFSFLNDSGVPMYRYTSGDTIVHAALVGQLAVVGLDAQTVKDALKRREADTGLAAKASRELLNRIRLRDANAMRVMVDTDSVSRELLASSPLAPKILEAVEIPEQSMLDLEMSNDRIRVDAGLSVEVSLPVLEGILRHAPGPIGVLRYVPASAYLLTVSNIATLGELYPLVAAFRGKDVTSIYDQADSAAKTVTGMGVEELLFSWVGAEVGAFLLPESADPVLFARITDSPAYERALKALTGSVAANKDSTLVLDQVRIDRLSIPWFVAGILSIFDVDIPEPYFIVRGNYFFLSLDAANLTAVARAGDTGSSLMQAGLYADLTQGIPADPALLVWYDVARSQPFFLRGTGLLSDVLRLYSRGLAIVRATPTEVRITLTGAKVAQSGAQLLPGFPLTRPTGASEDVLAFRFSGSASPNLAWVRNRSTIVLADAGGAPVAEAVLEAELAMVPEGNGAGRVAAIWAVSSGGTVWRLGPALQPTGAFPIATGVTGTMPSAMVGEELALFSRSASTLVLVNADGAVRELDRRLDAPLFVPPHASDRYMAFYPKSFDAMIHLTDLEGTEVPGWPVQASGISFCAPRLVQSGQTTRVSFLTQAGALHLWDLSGNEAPGFPVTLPGVFYATPEPMDVDGSSYLVAVAQDGSLSMIAMSGEVTRQTHVPDLDGKNARIFLGDIDHDGVRDILLYGSGAFITGYDAAFRPLSGFPVKGMTRPQLVDLDGDGRLDILTAGLDGKVYAYTMSRGRQ